MKKAFRYVSGCLCVYMKEGSAMGDYMGVFQKELLKNHRIDKELYTRYDVK